MVDFDFAKTESSTIEMTEVAHLVRKVMQFGFGEVVVKVQDGKIVLLEERLTHKTAKGINASTKL